MLKKRIIFTLIYDRRHFMLSRNFQLQKIGDLTWLFNSYNFSQITKAIDELIVLDVTRGEKDTGDFCRTLHELTKYCFAPVAAGGGIQSIQHAYTLLRAGADKVVLNTAVFQNATLIGELASEFGKQCLVASVDLKRAVDMYQVWVQNGKQCLPYSAKQYLEQMMHQEVGEIYLNSIDQDGTGQGFDMNMLDQLPLQNSKPIILAGGVGNATHLSTGLIDPRVDAVATANLLNFVGDGLIQARYSLLEKGFDLPIWDEFPRVELK